MTGQDIQFLDLTLPTPAQNLACDEALLDACDAGTGPQSLRFWESTQYFAVVGFSNQADREINVEACRREDVPIYRRCSGGGSVLQGPGCLNYTLVLRIDESGPLASIASTNRHIMERHAQALGRALTNPDLKGSTFIVAGHTDAAGGEAYNQELSERRADSIKKYLSDKFGIAGSDLVTVGYGKSKLKDPNAPMAEANRRVQVVNMENKTTASK